MSRQFGALRGLAIAVVVLYHTIDMGDLGAQGLGYPGAQGALRYLLLTLHQLGIFAVPVFLFISGSFAAYATRGNPVRMPWRTLRAGLRRIVWPYIVWSAVFYAMVYFRRDEAYTVAGYLKNLVVGYPFHFIPLLVFWYATSLWWAPLAGQRGWLFVSTVALYQTVLVILVQPRVLGVQVPRWARYLVPPVLGNTLALWGVYFPLGLVYGLHSRRVTPVLDRFKHVSVIALVVMFAISLLDAADVIHFQLAARLCPLIFLALVPLIRRSAIPMVRDLEQIGKRSYGLYLTHLIVLELAFLGIQNVVPWLLDYQGLLQPVLFTAALGIPLGIMESLARLATGSVYRIVFG